MELFQPKHCLSKMWKMDGHFTWKSVIILIDSANFAVWVYLIMAQLSWYHQVCLRQESGSSHLNSCPDLNKSGQGRTEAFPQWDPESCYRFGPGPNCSNPMSWLYFSVPAVLTSCIVLFQTNFGIVPVPFQSIKGGWGWGIIKSNKSDKLSDWLSPAQIASIGRYSGSSETSKPLIITVNEPV